MGQNGKRTGSMSYKPAFAYLIFLNIASGIFYIFLKHLLVLYGR
jgi:hypothetical protein